MSRRPSRRGRSKQKKQIKLPSPAVIEIESLESHGDGAGEGADGKRVYVPSTLPGDRVEVEFVAIRGDGYAARAKSFVNQVPRRQPDCDVFDVCGGCQLQHVPEDDYKSWKSNNVKTALGRQGLEPEIRPLQITPLASRRRSAFTAKKMQKGVLIGYNSSQSNQIIDINHCPRLIEPLNRLIGPLRALANGLLPANGDARFALTQSTCDSIDLMIETNVDLSLEHLETLSAFAHEHNISRITRKSSNNLIEPIIELIPVMVPLSDVKVPLPADSFLQPSVEGERTLTNLVLEAASGCQHVIDMYAGIGTFSVPLAGMAKSVLAVDGAPHQIAALQAAINGNVKLANIITETRDLQRNAMMASELKQADLIVFDPPRAGAKKQAFEISQSDVPKVIAVSCNPATMARDLRALVDGGYQIEHVTPVDQFPMSYHVEAVALLSRP
jgi:23S rRNA (uracil1939-C5)-methyltransferase